MGEDVRARVHARKINIIPIDRELKEMLIETFKGLCGYCRKKPIETWDHVIPISKRGDSTSFNVVPACKSCNSSKKNHPVLDWIEKKGLEISDELESQLTIDGGILYG